MKTFYKKVIISERTLESVREEIKRERQSLSLYKRWADMPAQVEQTERKISLLEAEYLSLWRGRISITRRRK